MDAPRADQHQAQTQSDAKSRRDAILAFIGNSRDAVIVYRLDGTILLWNPGAEALYGWSATEVVGQSMRRVIPPDAQAEHQGLLDVVRTGKPTAEVAVRRVRKGGQPIEVGLTATPFMGADGRVEGVATLERDITRRRRLQGLAGGQRRLLETLFRSERLQEGLRALLDVLLELTAGVDGAAVMLVDGDLPLLNFAAGTIPEALERKLHEGIPVAPGGHPAGEAAFQRQAVSVADVRTSMGWDATRKTVIDAGLLSCCAIPIVAPGGALMGTLDLYGRAPREPSADDIEVAMALAGTAAVAIQRSETMRELRQGREVFGALNEINALLVADLDSDRIIRRATEEATRLVGAQMGAFFQTPTTPGSLDFQLHSLVGPFADRFANMPMPRTTPLFSQALDARAVQRLVDVTKDPRFGKNAPLSGMPDRHPPVRSFMIAPVSSRSGEIIGMLIFGHEQPGRFSRWHGEILQGIASQTALALEGAKLYRQASERAEALATADQRKDEFLALLGHELRNPLGAMIASLSVIEGELPDDADAAHDALTVFRRQSRHMQRLVDDLLDLSRITRGHIRIGRETMDLSESVRSAVEAAQVPTLKLRQTIKLSVPDRPVWVSGDAIRLEQVLGNLLHNARKFSPRGSAITVALDANAQQASVRVRDQGRGIDKADLDSIFEMFAQAADDKKGQSGEGLGLGLALVREIVTLHGGAVRAYSEGAGKGSEFEVRLPVCAPPPKKRKKRSRDSGGPVPVLRILLAEDQPDAARAMSLLLRHWGHRVTHVDNGHAALETARSRRPDVCLLDIGLPGMDGWEVAEKLRKEPRLEDMRLAALTGLGQQLNEAASLQAGFERHFAKAADPDALKTWLEDVALQLA